MCSECGTRGSQLNGDSPPRAHVAVYLFSLKNAWHCHNGWSPVLLPDFSFTTHAWKWGQKSSVAFNGLLLCPLAALLFAFLHSADSGPVVVRYPPAVSRCDPFGEYLSVKKLMERQPSDPRRENTNSGDCAPRQESHGTACFVPRQWLGRRMVPLYSYDV